MYKKISNKFQSITLHKGTEKEYGYSSTIPLNS